jgi:hypothetical protein
METKLGTLLDSEKALSVLGQEKNLPASIKYRVAVVIGKLVDEVKRYSELQKELLEKYAKLNDEKDQYVFNSTEEAEAFSKEINALRDEPVTLSVTPFEISNLDNTDISAIEMRSILWLIVE